MEEVDITVIGGGINGVSVAAEAASRGLRTVLVHDSDLASGGSATPVTLSGTHLQHLSALDYFQLNTMLDELQRLGRTAPHLLELLPVTQVNGEPVKETGEGLIEKYFQGVRDKSLASMCTESFSTKIQSLAAKIKPSRLIICKALQAQKYGAIILPRHKVTSASRQVKHWELQLERQPAPSDTTNETATDIKSNIIINCSGWWANELMENLLHIRTRCKAKEEHRTQFFFRNPGIPLKWKHGNKNRVIKLQGSSKQAYYAYPVVNDILAFGPRKCDQQGYAECIDLQQGFIDTWNQIVTAHYPHAKLTPEHFVFSRKSLLALIADPCSNSDTPMTTPLHDLDNPGGAAILLNIFGVDAAIHRKTAHQALDILQPFLKKKARPGFKDEILPGGDIQSKTISDYVVQLSLEYPQLPGTLLSHIANNYGNLAYAILGESQTIEDMGEHFGGDLYQREVDYLMNMEWASTPEDIIWRRSLIAFSLGKNEVETLRSHMKSKQKHVAHASKAR
ncbi:FAD-dependent oxidoreductase [Teredinibacter haidensis]|uniref:FAD-dependent oxidoreductase n=1 Tax=Teredinibacter haidensis TaxID=2731755 RepID=UPI000948F696|nr:FAD-dependent oxidoreductase [Teredinibacter haidensis]